MALMDGLLRATPKSLFAPPPRVPTMKTQLRHPATQNHASSDVPSDARQGDPTWIA